MRSRGLFGCHGCQDAFDWLLLRLIDGPDCHYDKQGVRRELSDVSRGLVRPVVLSYFGLGVALIGIEVMVSVVMRR